MRVPLSSRTLLLLELIIEPAVVELEAADDNVMPGMPTPPWLVEVSPPATFVPVFGPATLPVCKVDPATLPVVFATPPAVEPTPPTSPPRGPPGWCPHRGRCPTRLRPPARHESQRRQKRNLLPCRRHCPPSSPNHP